ncbi:MAG: response regulator [Phycisphaerales bacterium]|nr:response regulator [Phycisphaerales bacterium]
MALSRLGLLLPAFIRRRVGLQLVVVCGSVLAVAALASGTYTAESQKRVVLAEVERQGQMLVNVLAMCCPNPMIVDEVSELRAYVNSLVDTDRVIWAEIVRADGKVLASNGRHSTEGRRYSAPIRAPMVDGSAPPADEPALGMAHVELSTAHATLVAAASSRLLFNQWGLTFLVLAVALGLVFRFLIHGRLDRLARQAVRLGGGDLETPVELGAPDEFGQLASTLDNVRRRLRTSYRDLQERNTQLQELDRLKSEFWLNVSHEIRTPLNGILGFSEMLLHRSLEPDIADVMDTIFTSACSLRSVVDDVLEFSKLEAGEVRIAPEPVVLRNLLADIAQLYAAAAWQKGIELVVDVAPSVHRRVLADPLRMRQILSNLLNNAVKFTEKGEIVLRVELIGAAAESAQIRFSITDTGIGFDPKHADKLFRSFQQVDGSISRRFGGTGLGLAIARHLVERMGGTIHAESQQGVGSRFWLDVPLAPMSASDADSVITTMPGAVQVIAARESLRIALAHELEAQGHECDVRADAAAVATGRAPSAVLLVVDGTPQECVEQVAALRGKLPAPTPRVVAILPPGASAQAEDLGADQILLRPVRADRLRDALGRAARVRPARVEPVAATQRMARVLVVDDNAVNCKLAGAMLKKLGHAASAAQSGQAALEALAGGAEYDLILMDCQMPEMDGFQATRRIRAMEGPVAGIPIIAFTANNLAGDPERCAAAGMDDYLAKPIELARLSHMVEKWAPIASGERDAS